MISTQADGTLLCALAERLTGMRVLHGRCRRPTTRLLREANARKALSCLRDWDVPLGWRHPDPRTEVAVQVGDWRALLPLLEDCYRVFHGKPPRAARSRPAAGAPTVVADDGELCDRASGDAVAPCCELPFPKRERRKRVSFDDGAARRRRSPSPAKARSKSPAPSWATSAGWSTPERAKRLLIPDHDDARAAADGGVRETDLDIFPSWPDRPFRRYESPGGGGRVEIEPSHVSDFGKY